MTPAPELHTERLVLRQWRDDDLDAWAALNADPRVMEHFPSTLTREESDHWARVNAARLDEQGWGLWAVEVRDGPAFIGFTGLLAPGFEVPGRPHGCVEVGWRLAAEHWGRGYAPEAAREVLHHAFDALGRDEVVSFTAVGNAKSRRVMEKLGMVHERDFDHPNLPGHRLERHALYVVRAPSGSRGRRPRSPGGGGGRESNPPHGDRPCQPL